MHIKKPGRLIFLVIILIIVIRIAVSHFSSKSNATEVAHTVASYGTPEYMLASMEYGSNNPPEYMIDIYTDILDELHTKCAFEEREQIADYVYKTYLKFKEIGQSMGLREIATGIGGMIPDDAGVISCAEVAAAWITLSNQR